MRITSLRPSLRPALLVFTALMVTGVVALADAPAGYYDTVDASNALNLRSTLHDVIDDHTKIPYTATSTDTWDVLEAADEDPNDSSRILDLYLNASYQKWGAGNVDYDREHTWPKSYGFPNDGTNVYPYTDCHQLFLCDGSRNGSRGNKPFGAVGASGTEYTTLVNDGVGGGSGVYPGWSNWADGTYWEVWADRRGDIARAMFYMDVRYEGGTNGNSGAVEPDLILTDNLTLIENSNTGSNETTAYMGLLSVLLQWHLADPVDAGEMLRNDIVYGFQGNRNPFVDHPDWAECLFGTGCGGGDVTPPAIPAGLVGAPGNGVAHLDWNDNGEGDLAGYSVYRSTVTGGPYSKQNVGLVGASQYDDNAVLNGSTYFYVVTATDLSGNESGFSTETSVTPAGSGTGGPVVWVNEFHYDNASTDVGEFFEIAGTAGTSLAGWSLIGYSGNGGLLYDTIPLSGVLPDQQNGYGTRSFLMPGLQNGAPDGFALVDDMGQVVQFLSYEGTFTAADGAASGLQSIDVGVTETSATPAGFSLQLVGSGSSYDDFTWSSAIAETPDQPNTGQTFIGVSAVGDVPGRGAVAISAAYPNPFNPATNIRWTLARPGHVRIAIFNVKGELVRTLLDESHAAGEFELRWNGLSDAGRMAPSGAYFCRIAGGGQVDTRPLLLLK
ncbi:endonuclease [bacterium]|nr:endonuclease [bacterium]